jgi:hypothetical protein
VTHQENKLRVTAERKLNALKALFVLKLRCPKLITVKMDSSEVIDGSSAS